MCGKEYEYCHSLGQTHDDVMRWQDVACCPEHGEEYFKAILLSRSGNKTNSTAKSSEIETAEKTPTAQPKAKKSFNTNSKKKG